MRFQKLCCVLMVVLVLILAIHIPSSAQVNTADLSGHVLDQSGARVPGAKVTVRKASTGATRSTEADAEGTYSFLGLEPGTYNLTAQAPGFTLYKNPVVLTVGQSAQANLILLVGDQGDGIKVNVTSAAQMIETQRTSNSETVSQRQI